MAEIHEALSAGNFNGSSISSIAYWSYPDANEEDTPYCKSILYASSHVAVGTSHMINTTSTPTDGGGTTVSSATGVQISYQFNQNCGNAKKILCCQ